MTPASPEPDGGRVDESPHERRRAAAVAGHTGDEATARGLLADPDPTVRAAAVGAMERIGALTADEVGTAVADPDPAVRCRAARLLADPTLGTDAHVVALLDDDDAWVVEMASWAVGERHGTDPSPPRTASPPPPIVLGRVEQLAVDHDDPLVRESAVAALGAIGARRSLDAVLAGTEDRPAIRRRAVLALAAFLDDDRAVAAARRAASDDRDWQVRDLAGLLLDGIEPPDDDAG